jgi:hypothetical protein
MSAIFKMAAKTRHKIWGVKIQHCCGGHFDNGDRLKFFNVGNKFGTSLSTHISHFDDIGQC